MVRYNTPIDNLGMQRVIEQITQWHYDRNLISGSTDNSQLKKLFEEVEELRTSIEISESPIDDIGDIIVVLINIAERNGLSISRCIDHAYKQIKGRTGKMVEGVFVKDLPSN